MRTSPSPVGPGKHEWSDAWLPLLDVADELWPSSQFTAAALAGPAAEAGKPLQVMPMSAASHD